jgi:hypothetical protein
VTYGTCRITILDLEGRPQVAHVKEGGLWYFPAGLPHSLQGLPARRWGASDRLDEMMRAHLQEAAIVLATLQAEAIQAKVAAGEAIDPDAIVRGTNALA